MADNTRTAQDNASGSAGLKALWIGIAASLALTAAIWLIQPILPRVDFLPDQGPSWYFWKLPEPTFWSHFTAWAGYLLHQVAFWWLIYRAQKDRLKFTAGLKPVNYAAFGINALFVVLHLVQTSIWFDGLAQDVSIWSSQASVVIMLVLILHMENRRRGLFFGRKVRASFFEESAGFIRRYHGYIFSWGIIYTFWYHPAVATAGHLLGFLYIFLLLVQGSLMFTRVHLNRWWTVSLELIVTVHGTIVAVLQGADLWTMFLFGFLAIFVVTQMYGLDLSKRQRSAIFVIFLVTAAAVYSERGLIALNEIVRIPLIEYLAAFLLAFLVWGGMRLAGMNKSRSGKEQDEGSERLYT